MALYATMPPRFVFGKAWVMPLVVLVFLIPLIATMPLHRREPRLQRVLAIALIATMTLFNVASVVTLVLFVLGKSAAHKISSGEELLMAAVPLWVTNVLIFALWFWETDAGGPIRRGQKESAETFSHADFVFPQMSIPNHPAYMERNWKPLLLDYVFLAFNNATAFSPADTFPLTRRAKVMVMSEALTSLVTLAVIAARAINILT